MVKETLCAANIQFCPQVAIELPYILVQSLIYGVLVYAMIGFEWTAAKFFWYLFFMYFTLSYYTFYGMMSVGLTPSYNVASVVSTAFYAIWNLFSGFIIPRTVSILIFHKCLIVISLMEHLPFLIQPIFLLAANSNMVEMVLLDLPCCMDNQWVGYFTVWGCR